MNELKMGFFYHKKKRVSLLWYTKAEIRRYSRKSWRWYQENQSDKTALHQKKEETLLWIELFCSC